MKCGKLQVGKQQQGRAREDTAEFLLINPTNKGMRISRHCSQRHWCLQRICVLSTVDRRISYLVVNYLRTFLRSHCAPNEKVFLIDEVCSHGLQTEFHYRNLHLTCNTEIPVNKTIYAASTAIGAVKPSFIKHHSYLNCEPEFIWWVSNCDSFHGQRFKSLKGPKCTLELYHSLRRLLSFAAPMKVVALDSFRASTLTLEYVQQVVYMLPHSSAPAHYLPIVLSYALFLCI